MGVSGAGAAFRGSIATSTVVKDRCRGLDDLPGGAFPDGGCGLTRYKQGDGQRMSGQRAWQMREQVMTRTLWLLCRQGRVHAWSYCLLERCGRPGAVSRRERPTNTRTLRLGASDVLAANSTLLVHSSKERILNFGSKLEACFGN